MLTALRRPAGTGPAVLVLHGGSADSPAPTGRWSPAVLRLVPVASAVARAVPGAAVFRLRNSVRGWNGDGAAVLGDARWAVERIASAGPGRSIVLVGHSLGGRVAAHLAATAGSVSETARVAGAVLLAPWLEPPDPVDGLAGMPLTVVQGTRDRMIPSSSTQAWLARAARAGALIERATVPGGEHTMLRHAREWHRLCIAGVGRALAAASPAH